MEEVKQKMLEQLSQYWKDDTENIKIALQKGKEGAEELLDWCRDDYDKQENTENELLDRVWDICNWYLDFCNGDRTKENLLSLIEIY